MWGCHRLPCMKPRVNVLLWRRGAQMGGAAGVEAAEVNCLTLQPGAGMLMRAVPRVAA